MTMRILLLSFYYQPDLCAGSFRATAMVKALLKRLPAGAHLEIVTTAPNRYVSYSDTVTGGAHAVEQHDQSVRKDAYWFGEGQSRVVVSVNPSKESDFLASFAGTAVAVNKLGIVAGDVVVIGGQPWGNLQTWQQPYDNKIGGLMQ
jgi:hypothetical protein